MIGLAGVFELVAVQSAGDEVEIVLARLLGTAPLAEAGERFLDDAKGGDPDFGCHRTLGVLDDFGLAGAALFANVPAREAWHVVAAELDHVAAFVSGGGELDACALAVAARHRVRRRGHAERDAREP